MNTHIRPSFPIGSTVHLLGTLVTLRANGADTDGAFSLVEIAVAPGQGTPPHRHDDAEAFYVLEGEMTFVIEGQPSSRKAGEFVHIPSQVPHAFRNTSGAVARMLGINLPGGPHIGFFAEVGEPVANAQSFPPLLPPDVPRLIEAGLRHGITILPPGVSQMHKVTKLVLAAALAAAIAGGVSMVRLDLDPVALEAQYATAPSRFVEVDGIRFHVRDRGTGPAIVLVHGQSANLLGWEAWAEDLARDHRVITLDLPGHGLTGPDPQKRYSWAELAERIDALAIELRIGKFVLVGNSLGGAISVSYALSHGERLDGLVLLDAIGAPRDEPKPLIFELYATPVIGQLITFMTPDWMVRASLESSYGDPSRVTDRDVIVFSNLMRRAGNREAARQIVSQPNDPAIPAGVGTITTPALLMWGGKDTWVAPRYGDWYDANLPNSDLVVFSELGHMPMIEAPAPTLAALRQFLDRIGE